MKRMFAFSLVLLVLAAVAVSGASAQQPVLISANSRARIHRMGAFGNGLAISQSDPMDFELLKVGIAGVKVGLADETAEVRVGILYFGEEKYRMRNVEIGNGTASGDIYSNDTVVGTISLDSYVKGSTEIWAGTLSLDGDDYNAYVIQISRALKAVEKAVKAFDYCRNNPERCRAAMQAVGNIICDPVTDENCRNRIRSFCEGNPEDSRCKRLKYEYCKDNLDDAECRAEIMEACRANYNDVVCEKLGNIYNRFAEKMPAIANTAPTWLKAVTARIRNRVTTQTPTVSANNTGNQGGQ